MSNQRSVMTEFRRLDQKRQVEGLTAEEANRYAQLRDLVGAEPASPPRAGFDLNAAAARLRESLLPAGLRQQPAEPAPVPPETPPAAAPETLALEQAWAEAPFAELAPAAADPLFDPGSMTQEVRPQAWNPEAPGYDPNAPYDEAAWIAAGYDPNATYDWSAYGYGPDGQPLAADAGAAPVEPAAEPPLEQPFEQPLEQPFEQPFEQPVEVVEPPLEGAPLEGAASAPAAWDAAPAAAPATDQPWAAAFEGQLPESSPEPAWEAAAPGPEPVEAQPEAPTGDEALPFDPNAPFDHEKWFGRASREAAADLTAPPEGAPSAFAAMEQAFEPAPEAAPPAPLDFGTYDEAVAAVPSASPFLEAAAPPAEEPPVDLALGEAGAPTPDGGSDWLGDVQPASHLPAPEGAPFGEYDEAATPQGGVPAAGLEAMLPFDPAAAAAIEAGAVPEGYEPGGPALDPASLPPIDAGADEAANFASDQMYGGPEGDGLPGGTPLELGEGMPDWQPEAALEQGFELASDGSFGHGDPPLTRTPAWGTALPATPAEGWANAPALDLTAPFEGAAEPAATAGASPAAEELPTVEGAEILEELSPEAVAPVLESMPVESMPVEPLPDAEPASMPLDDAFGVPFGVPDAGAPLADLPAEPAEPEPAVSYEAAAESLPPEIAAAYAEVAEVVAAPEPAPAPAGDAFELPPVVAEGLFEPPPPPLEAEPLEAEPVPPQLAAVSVPGSHRVVLHTVDGQVKRGLLVDAVLDASSLPLQPQGPGAPEDLPTDGIKAIFFMLSPGEKAPAPEGKKVRVTFRDGRQVAGFSPDYQEGLVGFFMIPADTRTNTGRIWVYQSAVKAVAVS